MPIIYEEDDSDDEESGDEMETDEDDDNGDGEEVEAFDDLSGGEVDDDDMSEWLWSHKILHGISFFDLPFSKMRSICNFDID